MPSNDTQTKSNERRVRVLEGTAPATCGIFNGLCWIRCRGHPMMTPWLLNPADPTRGWANSLYPMKLKRR